MTEFLFAQANMPFTASLAFVLLLGIFESVSIIVGFSIFSTLEDWLPNSVNLDAPEGFTGVAGWLCLHRLPLLIWFVLALISFSIAGYSANFLALLLSHQTLPQFMSLPIALVSTGVSCRYLGAALAKILPKSESSAVAIDSLCGQVATVTSGRAVKGNPTEALIRDQYQQCHYLLVEPELVDVEFNTGTQVVLLKRAGTVWLAANLDS